MPSIPPQKDKWRSFLPQPGSRQTDAKQFLPVLSNRGDGKRRRTIHILGADVTAAFLAHNLRRDDVAVEMITPSSVPRLRLLSRTDSRRGHDALIKKNTEVDSHPGPIKDLIVTQNTLKEFQGVAGRLDESSTVCVVSDGLGLADEIKQQVWSRNRKSQEPALLLGHIPHTLRYRADQQIIKVDPNWRLLSMSLAGPAPSNSSLFDEKEGLDSRALEIARDLQTNAYLKAETLPMSSWLSIKLPHMLFPAVVDSVCASLECRYDELLTNPYACRLVDSLLDEVGELVLAMQEFSSLPSVHGALKGDNMRRDLYDKIRRRGGGQSVMAMQVHLGRHADIGYTLGYLIKRGTEAGLRMPGGKMVMNMVLAKVATNQRRSEDYVPFDWFSRLH